MNIIVGRQNTEYGDCVELDLSLWFKKGSSNVKHMKREKVVTERKGLGRRVLSKRRHNNDDKVDVDFLSF